MLAFKALPSIEEPARFAAWLAAITRHRAIRFSKREQRSRRVPMDELLLEQVQALARPLVRNGEAVEELRLALDEMPPVYAMVLSIRFLNEMPRNRLSTSLRVP